MENISQAEFIGMMILTLVVIISFVKVFVDYSVRRNQKDNDQTTHALQMYSELKETLIENTLTTRSLRDYIQRLEDQTNKRLDDHEARLDKHRDMIVELQSITKLQIKGASDGKN